MHYIWVGPLLWKFSTFFILYVQYINSNILVWEGSFPILSNQHSLNLFYLIWHLLPIGLENVLLWFYRKYFCAFVMESISFVYTHHSCLVLSWCFKAPECPIHTVPKIIIIELHWVVYFLSACVLPSHSPFYRWSSPRKLDLTYFSGGWASFFFFHSMWWF